MFSFVGRVMRYLLIEVATVFLVAVSLGSLVWFIKSMFSVDTFEYFPYIRGIFVWALIFDAIIEFVKFAGRKENQW